MMSLAETLDGGMNQLGIELLDTLPAKPHAIQCAWSEVLNQHIGFLDQLLEDLFSLGGLGVQ